MAGSEEDRKRPIEPQGRAAGMPYDWRRPTADRVRARVWNPDEPRLWTPKAFGWGYDLNLYWLVHPRRYLRARRR
ncbi:DUF5808 domain-containing protein [Amycolatopsis sp. NPDC004378]